MLAPQCKLPKITGDRTELKVLPRALIDHGSSEKEESLTKLILSTEDAHRKSTISTHQAPESPKTYQGLYIGETLLSALVIQLLFLCNRYGIQSTYVKLKSFSKVLL